MSFLHSTICAPKMGMLSKGSVQDTSLVEMGRDHRWISYPTLYKTERFHMAYIQERKTDDGKIHYRVQVRLKGYPTTTATFERKTDAKLWAQQTEAAMREGRHFKTTEAKKHTVAELVDRYIQNVIPTKPRNAPACTAQLLWWKKQLGHSLLSDLTPARIAEQRDVLLKETTRRGKLRSSSTVVRYLAALSHALSIAMKEWGWVEHLPCAKSHETERTSWSCTFS